MKLVGRAARQNVFHFDCAMRNLRRSPSALAEAARRCLITAKYKELGR